MRSLYVRFTDLLFYYRYAFAFYQPAAQLTLKMHVRSSYVCFTYLLFIIGMYAFAFYHPPKMHVGLSYMHMHEKACTSNCTRIFYSFFIIILSVVTFFLMYYLDMAY